MSTAPLDLYFRGSRYYIQGSLVIPTALRAAEAVDGSISRDANIAQVDFRTIIDCHCVTSWDTTGEHDIGDIAKSLATIVLRSNGEPVVKLGVYRDLDRTSAPPRIDDTQKVIAPFKANDDGTAETEFFCRSDEGRLDAFLRGVVEFNKNYYEQRYPGCGNIIFAGLFDSTMRTSDDFYPTNGILLFRQLSVRKQGNRFLCVSETKLTGRGSTCQANVIFTLDELD